MCTFCRVINFATSTSPLDLAQRLGQVESLLAAFQAQNPSLLQDNESLRDQNQWLRQKLNALIRRYFGRPKNEGLDPNQRLLLLAGLDPSAAPPAPEKPSTPEPRHRRTPLANRLAAASPENLPIERVVLLPEEVKANPGAFRQIEEVVTRELDWEPAQFYWRHFVRPKFVRNGAVQAPQSAEALMPRTLILEQASAAGRELALQALIDPPEVFIAALPHRLLEKGLPGVGLLVHVLLNRFEDQLPFFRLEKIFRERHGVPLARQSLVDWTEQMATWLQPIYRQMIGELLAGGYPSGRDPHPLSGPGGTRAELPGLLLGLWPARGQRDF